MNLRLDGRRQCLLHCLKIRKTSLLICCAKDLKEGKKIRMSEPDVLKKAGQLFTLRFHRFQYFFTSLSIV